MAGVESDGAEHGVLLAALSDLRGPRRATRCLERVAGDAGERCRERLRELGARDAQARRAALAALAHDLQSRPPRELALAHPERIQALLDALPPELVPGFRQAWARCAAPLRWPEPLRVAPATPLQVQLPRLVARLLAASTADLTALRDWPSARVLAAVRGLGLLLLASLLSSAPTLREPLAARLTAADREALEAASASEALPVPRHLRATPSDDLPLELALQALEAAPASLRTRLASALPSAAGIRLRDAAGEGELAPILGALLRGDRLAAGGQ